MIARRGGVLWRWALLWLLLAMVCWPRAAHAGMELDSVEQLRLLGKGVTPPKQIDGARFRVAVFAFEDRDGLRLSEPLATLVAHQVLLGSRVSSLGVLRFSDPMSPAAEAVDPNAGYFERIDKLATAQAVTLSLWGTVRREGDEAIVVDTYLQLPAETVALGLQLRQQLPQATLRDGPPLLARVGGDRVLLQRLRLTPADADGVRAAAVKAAELRARAEPQAPVVGVLPRQRIYAVLQQISGWSRVAVEGKMLWLRPPEEACRDRCTPLLDGGRFVSALMRFIEGREPIVAADTLSREAQVFALQTRALAVLDRRGPGGDPMRPPKEALALLEPLLALNDGVPPPFVAGSANLLLLARVSLALRESAERTGGGPYDSWRVRREAWSPIAFDAAEALQHEPQNVELLHNLSVLFRLAGLDERARLAGNLLEQARGASRLGALR